MCQLYGLILLQSLQVRNFSWMALDGRLVNITKQTLHIKISQNLYLKWQWKLMNTSWVQQLVPLQYFCFIVLQGLLGLAYPPVGAWGDHVIVGSWLDSVECFLEYSVSFKLELCGVQNRSNATHYGRFSMICK